jgi:hypothetical protein
MWLAPDPNFLEEPFLVAAETAEEYDFPDEQTGE